MQQRESIAEWTKQKKKTGELEKRKFEIIWSEENKEKSMKHNEESLRDVWDTIKRNNL